MVAARALAKDFIPASPPSSSLSLMHFFKPMVDKRSPPSLSSMWPFTYHAFSLWPLCSCPISITFALHAARTSEHVLTSDHFEQTSRQKPTIRLLCKKSMTMEGGKSWYYAYMFKVWFKSPNYFWTLSTPTIYINEVKTDGKIDGKKLVNVQIDSYSKIDLMLSESTYSGKQQWQCQGCLFLDVIVTVSVGQWGCTFCHNRICVTIPLSQGWVTRA